MSMIKFSTSSENISSNGGFSFVSGILASIPAMSLWDRILAVRCNTRFSHQGIVLGAIGLMTAGCCDFADIDKFSGDPMFRHLVEKDIPSQETFRQRLDQLALTSWTPAVDGVVASLLRKVADEMRPGSKHSEKGPWNFSDGAWASCWRQAARHPSCF